MNKFQEDQEDDFGDETLPHSSASRAWAGKRLLLGLLARWYWPVLGIILGLGGAGYYLKKTPPRYSSTATILVKQNMAGLISEDQVQAINVESKEGLNTVVAQIRRTELLKRVGSRPDVRALEGLLPPAVSYVPEWFSQSSAGEPATSADNSGLPDVDAVGGMLARRLRVSNRNGTRLLDITITHEVPKTAKALADAIVLEYIEETAAKADSERTRRSRSLVDKSENTRARLQQAESALAIYNRALEVHQALEESESEMRTLARRYRSKHPRMQAAVGQLEELKQRFLEEFRLATQAPADKSYWESNREQLQAAVGDGELELATARQLLLARTGVLKGETESLMSVFNAMLTRLTESDVNRLGDESNVEVSSLARVPGQAVAPVPLKIGATGVAGGGVAGAALALLLFRLDNRFVTVSQVEQETSLPVLAALPLMTARMLEQATRNGRKGNDPVSTASQEDKWSPELVFRKGVEDTLFAEAYRTLRASVTLLGGEHGQGVILFTSALPSEGKTITSANYALSAARQGQRVLLLDLDLRKPSLHRQFGLKRRDLGPGITDLLVGRNQWSEGVTRDLGCENLDAIFSGTRAPQPGELLRRDSIGKLLEQLREEYDCIVIDTAPMLPVPDTRVLLTLVDRCCLVVRARFVPRGAVQRAISLFEDAGRMPDGIVLNAYRESRRMMGENYSYGSYRMSRYGRAGRYGYGSYGSYGSYGTDDD